MDLAATVFFLSTYYLMMPVFPTLLNMQQKQDCPFILKRSASAMTPIPTQFVFALKGRSNGVLRLTGCSIGGGRIKITELNGFPLELTGQFSALITMHHDRPGVIHSVTGVLASRAVNVAEMRVSRRKRGSTAVMVIDVDGIVPKEVAEAVAGLPQIIAVRRLNPIVD